MLKKILLSPATGRSLALLTTLACGGHSVLAQPPTLDPTYGLPLPPVAAGTAAPVLPASWIWAARTSDSQTVWFRKTVALAKLPAQATLYITCDDIFTLYVNGQIVAATIPNPADGNNWQHVQAISLTGLLKTGDNLIAVQAVNVAGPGGLVAAMVGDGTTIAATDNSWKVFAGTAAPDGWTALGFDDTGWNSATPEAAVTGGAWEGSLDGWPGLGRASYLRHLTLRAATIAEVHPGSGTIAGADSLTGTAQEVVQVNPAEDGAINPPYVLLDFGQEMAGRIQVSGTAAGTAVVSTGESKEECLNRPWGGPHPLLLRPGSVGYSPYSAFRYVKIAFFGSAPMKVTECDLDDKYYPVQYLGSFRCSDPVLTQIWYTGAYTAHLCMQEDIWDAPKRDRARWVGDLHVSGEVIEDIFLDKFLMEQTMTRLRAGAQGGKPDTEPASEPVNDIPGYSAAWVGVLDEMLLHSGDIDYLRSQHNLLLGQLEYMRQDLDEHDLFANLNKKWMFVDWSPGLNSDNPETRAATHLFYVYAFKTGAELLRDLGDTANSDKYAALAASMTAAAQANLVSADSTFGPSRQVNAMAIDSGVATPAEQDAIYRTVLNPAAPSWKVMASPYYNNYVIYALSQSGHTGDALQFIRSYWGGMIAEGATTFWEGYDLSWPKENFHSHLQADNITGYNASLCHGWSAGATSFLTDRILGVRPTSPGFGSVTITPELCDLAWAEGDVPTPQGQIHLRVEKNGGGETIVLRLPAQVNATVIGPGTSISVDGKAVPITRDGGRVSTVIGAAGSYRVAIK